MVDVAGHTRLLDFGIAARAELDDDDALYGTPGFLSPEQARGERLAASSDLFSLGCVLHFAVTGRTPFAANDIDGLRALVTAPALALGEANAGLAPMIAELLAPRAEGRPASARSVARALGALSLSLDGSSDEDTAAQLLAARASEVRSEAPRESDLPISRDPEGATPARVETLAKSQALDAMLRVPAIAPPSAEPSPPLAHDDGPRTARLERAPKPARPTGAATPAPSEAPALATSAPPSLRSPAIAALVALVLTVGLLSLARFEAAPTEPIDAIDRGLIDPADIVPLPIVEDDGAILEDVGARADAAVPGPSADVDTAGSDAGAPLVHDAGMRAVGGSVSVRATPWARVSLDGRPVGTTPIRRTSVSPGPHTIRLECPPLGRRVEATFRVEAGRSIDVTADLDRDPPAITVSP